jgi:branched-chain amino acid transport system ATP-binding protein
MSALLEVQGLEAFYGRTKALHGLDLEVREGAITALLGANGAGKSTLLRAVCGMVPSRGEIRFAGKSIAGKATEEIARQGIAHVPEGRATFASMTVEENLRLGTHARKDRANLAADFDRVYAMFPVLSERRRQAAGTLSGGEQQMLAVARALLLRPRLLLLDEPSLGVAPMVVTEIFRVVKEIHQREGVSVLLVEQNARLALDLAESAYLLETGRVVASGPSAALQQDDTIRRAYLGY